MPGLAVDEIENKTWEAVTGSRFQNKKETTASGFQRYFVFLFPTPPGRTSGESSTSAHPFSFLVFFFKKEKEKERQKDRWAEVETDSPLGLTLAHIFSSFPRNISFLCYAEMKKKTLRGKEERISARARPGKISASLW